MGGSMHSVYLYHYLDWNLLRASLKATRKAQEYLTSSYLVLIAFEDLQFLIIPLKGINKT